ncbi:hypothetical protein CXG81DRAFT_25447 [Caulochytrium protostelioides]|uniref:Ribonuclease P/MRP protein subunit POP5 n=1 Tax=Caulochytrium protostelioides TaxID=1555241 RepID=A0A4P9X973_9FUNG|nr:hypothetical protein CXG81DRAFT_25447 [Caulochytrium protostelioides]|eukprot:RKP01883.1 hypothetical protein CXG81DRAFT_25447 [Caulochytrium protostelioides]
MVRIKHRYLVIALHGLPDSVAVSSSDVWHALQDALVTNFGSAGGATCGESLLLKYWSPVTRHGVVRLLRDDLPTVWAAVTLITKLKGQPCAITVGHVGGTIKSCQQVLIRWDEREIGRVMRDGQLSEQQCSSMLKQLRKRVEGMSR